MASRFGGSVHTSGGARVALGLLVALAAPSAASAQDTLTLQSGAGAVGGTAGATGTVSAGGEAGGGASAEVAVDGEAEALMFEPGGQMGYARLDGLNYLAPTLTADVRVHALQSALRIPLRFDPNSGDLRKRDWDEAADFFRLAQCLRLDFSLEDAFEREQGLCHAWDVPRDDYYFSTRFGPIYDFDLGHGTILRSYSNTLDPDHFQAGAIADLQFHQFVVTHLIIDNMANPSLVGGTFGFRPFAYETTETADLYEQQHQVQMQVTAVSDLGAPLMVQTAFGQALTDGEGNLLYNTESVAVVGGDLQYRYVFGRQVEFEARADFNLITGHGMGGHLQAWWIYNHPEGDYSVRGIGEFRYVQDNYIPNYFDSYYFIQRQQYGLSDALRESLSIADDPFLTKQEFLNGLDAADWNMGYLGGLEFEARRGTGDAERTALLGRLYVSDNFSREADGQFLLSVKVPRLADKIDLYGLYSRQNFDSLVDVFRIEDTLVKFLVRWDLNEQFYLSLNYGRIWQLQVDTAGLSQTGFQSNDEFGFSLGFAEELVAGQGSASVAADAEGAL